MTTNNSDLLRAIDRALDDRSLEWAARWIEDSLKGETNARVIEFGKNMAITLRAAKLPDTRADSAGAMVDEDFALWLYDALLTARNALSAFQIQAGWLPEQQAYSTTMTEAEVKVARTVETLDEILTSAAIRLCAPAPPAAPRDDAAQDQLVDEVQHRMDQVVEAAVEWHNAGREGGEWFEAAEKLGAAINSLLELRDAPQCFCGIELEAGLCPNGHDPITPRVAITEMPVGKQPTVLDEALRLLTECCYTINALADQRAMPNDFYKHTLANVGTFMESTTPPAPLVSDCDPDG